MIQRSTSAAILILLGAVCTTVEAQDNAGAPYQPLFTDAMIRSAAPEQRERMRAAEENNRRAYERRQKASEQAATPDAAAPASSPPPRVRPRRSKIYRWVDDRGRVHFGDAPAGEGAEEITVRGSGASPPPRPPAD